MDDELASKCGACSHRITSVERFCLCCIHGICPNLEQELEALRAVAEAARYLILQNDDGTPWEADKELLREALANLAEVERGLCARCGKSHD